jgi:hypothetical protein
MVVVAVVTLGEKTVHFPVEQRVGSTEELPVAWCRRVGSRVWWYPGVPVGWDRQAVLTVGSMEDSQEDLIREPSSRMAALSPAGSTEELPVASCQLVGSRVWWYPGATAGLMVELLAAWCRPVGSRVWWYPGVTADWDRQAVLTVGSMADSQEDLIREPSSRMAALSRVGSMVELPVAWCRPADSRVLWYPGATEGWDRQAVLTVGSMADWLVASCQLVGSRVWWYPVAPVGSMADSQVDLIREPSNRMAALSRVGSTVELLVASCQLVGSRVWWYPGVMAGSMAELLAAWCRPVGLRVWSYQLGGVPAFGI